MIAHMKHDQYTQWKLKPRNNLKEESRALNPQAFCPTFESMS